MQPQLRLLIDDELIVDLFAGGGGMSTAIETALGRSPDIAINHNEEALSLHRANHPQTRHFIADVLRFALTGPRRASLLASCTSRRTARTIPRPPPATALIRALVPELAVRRIAA